MKFIISSTCIHYSEYIYCTVLMQINNNYFFSGSLCFPVGDFSKWDMFLLVLGKIPFNQDFRVRFRAGTILNNLAFSSNNSANSYETFSQGVASLG